MERSIIDINTISEAIRFLEANIEVTLHDLDLGNEFLKKTP